jgi:hypothetical protein
MSDSKNTLTRRIFDALGRLGSSKLVLLMGGFLLLDMVVPDPIFLLDEVVLGIATLLMARWRLRTNDEPLNEPLNEPPAKPPTKNITPPA